MIATLPLVAQHVGILIPILAGMVGLAIKQNSNGKKLDKILELLSKDNESQ